MKFRALLLVISAMAAGALLGGLTGTKMGYYGVTAYELYTLFSQLFLNALSLVVTPLVVSSIISGTSKLAEQGSFGRLGGLTLALFFITNCIAAATGLCFAIGFQPGVGEQIGVVSAQVHEAVGPFTHLSQLLLQMVPKNILASMVQDKNLGLILFSIVFGICLCRIETPARAHLRLFWEGVLQVMMRITAIVMNFLPLGVLFLTAKIVAEAGTETFSRVGYYLVTVIAALGAYGFIILPLLLLAYRVNPLTHFKAFFPALVTAFTTSSSAATIPITLECADLRPKKSSRISSFVISLGPSMNLSGSAVFVAVAVTTLAQFYGIHLDGGSIAMILVMTVVACTGMPGLPSASIITVMMVMQAVHIPEEGLGIIMAVDRLVDMSRTSITVWGNSCVAAIVETRSLEEALA